MKKSLSRIGKRWAKYDKKIERAPRSGPLQSMKAHAIIRGPYSDFIHTIIQSNNLQTVSYPTFSDHNLIHLDPEQAISIEQKLSNLSLKHGNIDDAEKLEIFEIIRFTVVSALRAVKVIEAEQGKNSGSANRRRSKAIQAFKQAKSDFSLLMSATRGAVRSTMQYRRMLQDTMPDQYFYSYSKKNGTTAHESKVWIADFAAISKVLNSDVEFCFRAYKAVKNATPVFDKLVIRYNAVLHPKPLEQ